VKVCYRLENIVYTLNTIATKCFLGIFLVFARFSMILKMAARFSFNLQSLGFQMRVNLPFLQNHKSLIRSNRCIECTEYVWK